MNERDRSPIDQDWIRQYCDKIIEIAANLEDGNFRSAVLLRVGHVQDLVEAWQKRKWPREEPGGKDGLSNC